MSKQISTRELAEVVTGLLVKPDVLGQLCTLEQHQSFMLDIGRVIADHCGGVANWVNHDGNGTDYPSEDDELAPLLSVSPNDSLPNLHRNVWAFHDTQGWEDEILQANDSEPLSSQEISETRRILQGLLASGAINTGESVEMSYSAVDWRVGEGTEVEEPGDETPYSVVASIGNQTRFEFIDSLGNLSLSVMIEIDHGVPTVHISDNEPDNTIHMHASPEGMVLMPDCSASRFWPAPVNRYSYHQDGAVVVR